MKNIIELKIAIGSTDNSFTDMINVHTCPIRSANLICTIVLVVDD
jgi:hypothetical protein